MNSYTVGNWLGRNWIYLMLAVIVTMLLWSPGQQGPQSGTTTVAKPQSPEEKAKLAADSKAAWIAQCSGNVETARQEIAKKKFMAARASVAACDVFTAADPKLKAWHAKLRDDASAEQARDAERAERVSKVAKKRAGVGIGMSRQDVIDSSWGKPRKINTTTTARGTSEQWVYDGGYLYFEDGVLRTIQN